MNTVMLGVEEFRGVSLVSSEDTWENATVALCGRTSGASDSAMEVGT